MERFTSTPNHLVVIISRSCFILADVLLILIAWSTIPWKSLVVSVSGKDVLSLAEVMLRNGQLPTRIRSSPPFSELTGCFVIQAQHTSCNGHFSFFRLPCHFLTTPIGHCSSFILST